MFSFVALFLITSTECFVCGFRVFGSLSNWRLAIDESHQDHSNTQHFKMQHMYRYTNVKCDMCTPRSEKLPVTNTVIVKLDTGTSIMLVAPLVNSNSK